MPNCCWIVVWSNYGSKFVFKYLKDRDLFTSIKRLACTNVRYLNQIFSLEGMLNFIWSLHRRKRWCQRLKMNLCLKQFHLIAHKMFFVIQFLLFMVFYIDLELNVADSGRLWNRLDQKVGVSFIRSLAERHFLPQIWRQESVGLGNGRVCCLSEVTQCCGWATALSVAIFDTGHLQQLLGNWSRNDACSTWSWDELDQDRTALAGDLRTKKLKFSLII